MKSTSKPRRYLKTARLHLTKRLAGSAAWKGERRDRPATPAETTNETPPANPVAA